MLARSWESSFCSSVRPSITRVLYCFVTNPKNLPAIFLYHILITANMQLKPGFPISHHLKSYVAPKSRLKFAKRCPVSSCWPSCWQSYKTKISWLLFMTHCVVRKLVTKINLPVYENRKRHCFFHTHTKITIRTHGDSYGVAVCQKQPVAKQESSWPSELQNRTSAPEGHMAMYCTAWTLCRPGYAPSILLLQQRSIIPGNANSSQYPGLTTVLTSGAHFQAFTLTDHLQLTGPNINHHGVNVFNAPDFRFRSVHLQAQQGCLIAHES